MKELIGYCTSCRKELYCLNGFFNGVILKDSDTLLCFECADNEKIEKMPVN